MSNLNLSKGTIPPLLKYKIVFLGDQAVGKSSIINRFIYDIFDGNEHVNQFSYRGLPLASILSLTISFQRIKLSGFNCGIQQDKRDFEPLSLTTSETQQSLSSFMMFLIVIPSIVFQSGSMMLKTKGEMESSLPYLGTKSIEKIAVLVKRRVQSSQSKMEYFLRRLVQEMEEMSNNSLKKLPHCSQKSPNKIRKRNLAITNSIPAISKMLLMKLRCLKKKFQKRPRNAGLAVEQFCIDNQSSIYS